jgi:thiosulfate/3-mercaptopyruvate sulfurtransferase
VWLAENLDNPNVRIVEVSVTPGLYEKGHISGAVNFVWHTDFVDTVSRDIVSPERFQELARAAGINNDSIVVLYGDNSNWFAAWGAWVFLQSGATDVRLLDGSRAKWEAESRELAITPPTPAPGQFTVAQRGNLRVKLPDVLQVVEGQQTKALIDPTTIPAAARAAQFPERSATRWRNGAWLGYGCIGAGPAGAHA